MVVKSGGEQNICSYTECRHERCNNCTTVMMDVPKDPLGITPIYSPIPDQIYLPHHPHQNNDEEEDERPSIRPQYCHSHPLALTTMRQKQQYPTGRVSPAVPTEATFRRHEAKEETLYTGGD